MMLKYILGTVYLTLYKEHIPCQRSLHQEYDVHLQLTQIDGLEFLSDASVIFRSIETMLKEAFRISCNTLKVQCKQCEANHVLFQKDGIFMHLIHGVCRWLNGIPNFLAASQ
jgi:hypothetical protein